MARITGQGPQTSFANPAWAKDYFNREHLIAGGARVDPLQFPRDDSVNAVLSAGYTANAASMTVTALAGPIPSNAVLAFSNGVTVYTTAAALAGATTLAVTPASFAVPSGAVATYHGTGRVYVANGTVLGRTYAERDAGTGFGPAAAGDAGAGAGEIYILAHDIDDALTNADATLYRPGSMIDEAHLAGWASLAAAIQTYIRTNYLCMRGAD